VDRKIQPDQAPQSIALVSPPWPLYTRPSIQLGTLKAFVRSRFPHIRVSAYHFYLQVAEAIGYRLYHSISERTWLAETVYGALLYPDRLDRMAQLFRREAAGAPGLRRLDIGHLASRVEALSAEWIAATDWSSFRLVGFSSVLCQLTACLYLIRHLKERNPHITALVGGSAFSRLSGAAALRLFPPIDAVVYGEGELPLAHLVQHHVVEGRRLAEMPAANGILIRDTPDAQGTGRGFSQLENLDHLPLPDFDDYFATLSGFSASKRFFPTLPVEFSRGCWWQRDSGAGDASGCDFCNLNLQWRGYRPKSGGRVVAEVEQLTRRHRVLSLAITDNVLPKESTGDILRGLAGLNRDMTLFAEIRATTPLAELELMRAAGLRTVQVGIEALSTRLLRKLHKGTTAIQNLEIMKHCEALGIANLSNLILHFPLSDEQDVEETLRTMAFSGSLRPPKAVGFWLGLGSPVWRNPSAYGIGAVVNHPNWSKIFPPAIVRSLPLMVQSYRGQAAAQRRLWRPVQSRLKAWETSYKRLMSAPLADPILSYQDGGEFMIIRVRRLEGDALNHRLEGTSRQIYLFCGHPRPLKQIIERFPQVAADKITSFLEKMGRERLMFAENSRFLSLASPLRSPESISSAYSLPRE
jgi:ribosomal peptide maturation radical SAM protein 1